MQLVRAELTSVIAGHPRATTTYRFYEELDAWLGPWGRRGYPIGYGKAYNVAFNSNPLLKTRPVTRKWVWRTTILLQEALRDYVVERVRAGTLGSLTELELREAAFESHARAYDSADLAKVVLVAPELIPIIASIPAVEFSPTSRDFSPSVRQVLATLDRVAPKVLGSGLAGLTSPTRAAALWRSVLDDRRALWNGLVTWRGLRVLEAHVLRGRLDHVPWLDQVIRRLNEHEFPNQRSARLAGAIVKAAEEHRRLLTERMNTWLADWREEASPGEMEAPSSARTEA